MTKPSNIFPRRARRLALATTFLCSLAAAPVAAQSIPVAPTRELVDSNGVDLFRGTLTVDETVASIGGNNGLRLRRIARGTSAFRSNIEALLQSSGSTYYATVDGRTDRFTLSGSTFTPTEANGSSLAFDSTSQIYTYTDRAGTIVLFDKSLIPAGTNPYGNEGLAISITEGNGSQLTLTYQEQEYCLALTGGTCTGGTATARRLASAKSAFGYMANVKYASDTLQEATQLADWYTVTDTKLVNLAVDYCAAGQAGCVTTYSWPSEASPNHLVNSYVAQNGLITGIKRPGSSSSDLTISYSNGKVSAVADHAGTTTYAYSDSGGDRTVTVTDALNQATIYTFDIATERLTALRDALNNTTAYQYDSSGRMTRATMPEGNYVQLTYDARGNVIERRAVAKSGSGLTDIVASAAYPSTCTNPLTCNKPTSTTDALGNVTDYTWASGHGGVLTITGPAPTAGAARPQKRYAYSSFTSSIKDASGNPTNGGPVVLPNRVAECVSGSTCTTANEVITVIWYPSGSGLHNIDPEAVYTGAGDSSLGATTAFAYDNIGNLVSVDGPLAGNQDTTTAIYDSYRRLVGTISPDPDGSGSRPRLAQRNTFATNGDLTRIEIGTVTAATASGLTGMTVAQTVDNAYDADGRKVRESLSGGGTTFAVTQFDYDAEGQSTCTAQRMNAAVFTSLPTSACSLGTAGSFGPDRITKLIRDADGRVTQVKQGYGTSIEANERTVTFTANGRLERLTDANSNRTTYEYDGHDRLVKTRYPVATLGADSSSTSDYEQLTLDAAGRVTARRLRDGQSIGFGYDALGRLTSKDLPGSEPDATYAYDLLSRMTSAVQNGVTNSFTWDALGRLTAESAPQGSVASQYDLAGRRTRVTLPGSTALYANYDYDVTGNVLKIRENGATSGIGVLATYAYDNLGRRTSVTFGNGVVQGSTFDNASRLATLGNDLSGTANDLTHAFTYSPAAQIAELQRTGDPYVFTEKFNLNDSSSVNGLNQIANAGARTIAHDSRGNITAVGSDAYGYSSENLLTSGPNSSSLAYDPAMRLSQVASGSSITRFGYDGLDRIAEYDGSNSLLRRYVHGAGADEPIVWYEGSGLSDRRFLSADERGSIVSVSDSSGSLLAINRYDEFGIPESTNKGKFGYTGQTWLPEPGLWHYKARTYRPDIGRFLQTDPIGFGGDGPNMYAYVLNDGVNALDPLGLRGFTWTGGCTICNATSITTFDEEGNWTGTTIIGSRDKGLEDFEKMVSAGQAALLLGRAYNTINFSNFVGTVKVSKPCSRSDSSSEDFNDSTLATESEVFDTIGNIADAAVVAGFLVAPINPAFGGALILGGRVAGGISSGVSGSIAIADAVKNGNLGGLISQAGGVAGAFFGGRQGAKVGKKIFGNQQIRNSLGQFGEKRSTAIKKVGQNVGGNAGEKTCVR